MHPALHRVRALVSTRPGVVIAFALLVVAGVAGTTYLLDSPTSPSPADSVPANVSYVGHVDAETMRSDPAVRNVTGRLVRFQSAVAFYDGPPFGRSYLFRESALPADAVDSVTYFGRVNSSYGARLVRADWRLSDLVSTVETDANVSLAAETYEGRPLYVGDGLAVASVENGTYVVGNATAVRDALDVALGTAPAVSGPIRKRFEARDGYLRFAYRFRSETVPDYSFVGRSIQTIEYVATGYGINGSNVTTEAVIVTEDADSARGVKGLVAFARTIYRVQTENETLAEELRKLRFEVEGRTVVTTYESTPARYRVLLRGLYNQQPEPRGGTIQQ